MNLTKELYFFENNRLLCVLLNIKVDSYRTKITYPISLVQKMQKSRTMVKSYAFSTEKTAFLR